MAGKISCGRRTTRCNARVHRKRQSQPPDRHVLGERGLRDPRLHGIRLHAQAPWGDDPLQDGPEDNRKHQNLQTGQASAGLNER
eukprot:7901213-Lingulodinium_polyedra.AAC.1